MFGKDPRNTDYWRGRVGRQRRDVREVVFGTPAAAVNQNYNRVWSRARRQAEFPELLECRGVHLTVIGRPARHRGHLVEGPGPITYS